MNWRDICVLWQENVGLRSSVDNSLDFLHNSNSPKVFQESRFGMHCSTESIDLRLEMALITPDKDLISGPLIDLLASSNTMNLHILLGSPDILIGMKLIEGILIMCTPSCIRLEEWPPIYRCLLASSPCGRRRASSNCASPLWWGYLCAAGESACWETPHLYWFGPYFSIFWKSLKKP